MNIHERVAFRHQTRHLYARIFRAMSLEEAKETLGFPPDASPTSQEVTKAYRDLQVMGIVNSRRGMGVFISKGIEAKCREQCRKDILGRLHEVVCEAKAAGMGAGEIKALTRACWASDASPYAETPAALLAAAKGGRK